MSERYAPAEIEARWQAAWRERDLFGVTETADRPKFYYLDMFPYPSGNLHMGHVRNYIIGDVIARSKVMQGYNVLHPMGWDAFGLPAENAAIQRQIHPSEWTRQCVEQMKLQFDQLGISFDWSREINASQPDYYKWTQWLFLQLYKHGLAYLGQATVNWCPSCQTVLANEELDGDRCERCGSLVEAQQTPGQWFFDIRKYADRLLDDLQHLDRWPERVRVMQEHWIGRSEGVSFRLRISRRPGNPAGHAVRDGLARQDCRAYEDHEDLEVFTTRIDTLYGVTYMVLAPEHPLVAELTAGTEYEAPVREFVREALRQGEIDRANAEIEKQGIFTGAYAIHPLTGEQVPIWVGDYVLMGYGTGAIMAVPAHDQRDFEFAQRYGLPIRVVIAPSDLTPDPSPHVERGDGGAELQPAHDVADGGRPAQAGGAELQPAQGVADGGRLKLGPSIPDPAAMAEAYVGDGVQVNSAQFDGLPNREAMGRIADHLEKLEIGSRTVNYKLRDWLISRQRYWGAPIPMVHCEHCGVVPVPEEDLPVLLPTDAEFKPTGESPLARHEGFVNTTCPGCGAPARRETDTMTTYVCSSWYYLRFADPANAAALADRGKVDYWCPVDKYVGGVEHAVRHLLYARFIAKVLHDLGYVGFVEPFRELFTQGMICGRTPEGKLEKMSKSKGNAVPADDIVRKYGADTARLYVLFVGPPDLDAEWSDTGVEGSFRFLTRVWRLVTEQAARSGGAEPTRDGGAELQPAPDVYPATDGGRLKPGPSDVDSATDEGRLKPGPSDGASDGPVRALRRKTHQTIQQVTERIDGMLFNTAISALMELTNEALSLQAEADAEDVSTQAALSEACHYLTLLLSPFAPHLCYELWEKLGHEEELFRAPWPHADAALAAAETVTIVVQVNGKVRGSLEAPVGADMVEVQAQAMALPGVQKHLEGKEIVKVIPVPGKLVNVVVR